MTAQSDGTADVQFQGYNSNGTEAAPVNWSFTPDLAYYEAGATSEVTEPLNLATGGAAGLALQFVQRRAPGSWQPGTRPLPTAPARTTRSSLRSSRPTSSTRAATRYRAPPFRNPHSRSPTATRRIFASARSRSTARPSNTWSMATPRPPILSSSTRLALRLRRSPIRSPSRPTSHTPRSKTSATVSSASPTASRIGTGWDHPIRHAHLRSAHDRPQYQ